MEARNRRPLRTYGRQPAQSITTTESAIEQPSTKRRCTEEIEFDDESPSKRRAQKASTVSDTPRTRKLAATSPRKTTTVEKIQASIAKASMPSTTALPPPPATTRKSAITNYFRVVPHPSSESSTCSEHTVPLAMSSPRSSPPPVQSEDLAPKPKRKPRRLTTRAKGRDSVRKSEHEEEGQNEEDDSTAGESPKNQESEHIMQATASTTLNRPITEPKKGKKRGATEMIQQTLSLSMSEKGFTECRECNMLYNPLHEKDRKFHARQHAAILKARAKGEGKENDAVI